MGKMKNNELKQKLYTLPVLLVMFVIGLYTMAKFDPKTVTASNLDKINMSVFLFVSSYIFYVILNFIRKNKKHIESEENIEEKTVAESDKNLIWCWEVDENGLYTYSSSEIEKLMGYKPEEIIRKRYFYDLFVAHEKEELKMLALEKFAEKMPFNEFINANIHKNGQIVWLKTSGTPIIDKDGNLAGYRGRDVLISDCEKIPAAVYAENAEFEKNSDDLKKGEA
jgi:PAS domain S-box-containing protein